MAEGGNYNQLELLDARIDALDTKINAGLKAANAEIDVVHTYYALKK
jgi:hypothetical protein